MDVVCEEESRGQKEAIYSFQLPEGSVATSLSLWVNGIERKGVLTTKEKAKEAEKASTSNQVNNTKPSHALTEYAGVYSNEAYGKFEIFVKGDSLFAKLKNQP